MDKYYLGRLTEEHIANLGKVKFVDVELASSDRTVRSLGLTCLRSNSIEFHLLHLANYIRSRDTKFVLERTIDLNASLHESVAIVELDITENPIRIPNNSPQSSIHCVALASNGDIFKIDLISGKYELLLNCLDQNAHALDHPLECKLHQTDRDTIHVLTEYRHASYTLQSRDEPNIFQLQGGYSLNRSTGNRFAHIHLPMGDISGELVMLELADGSIHFAIGSTCLAKLDFSERQDQSGLEPFEHLFLSTGSHSDYLLISARHSDGTVLGHGIHCSEREKTSGGDDKDPDNLLIQAPDFEVEELWSVDTKRNLRLQTDGYKGSLRIKLVPIFVENSNWPYYFAVVQEQSLTIYTFKQESINPFATTYDSSFNEAIPIITTQTPDNDFIEPREKPKFLLDFKLIGLGPEEALYNTLFLNSGTQIIKMRHYLDSGFIATLLNTGDILAFHIHSIDSNDRGSSESRVLVESIMESSCILDSIEEQVKLENRKLTNLLQRMESSATSQDKLSLSKLLQLTLIPDDKQACLYQLKLDVSSLVQVSRVMLVSTVSLHFLEPFISSGDVRIAFCQRNISLESNAAIVFSNIKLADLSRIEDLDLTKYKPNHLKDEHVYSWSVIELENLKDCYTDSQTLNCPLVLSDGQQGSIEVFCIPKSYDELDKYKSITSHTGYFSSSIQIKSLTSYMPRLSCRINDLSHKLEIEHLVSDKVVVWLKRLLDFDINHSHEVHLHSSLTNCCLHIKFELAKVSFLSDDILTLDLIRRHILKNATDEATQVKVSTLQDTGASLSMLLMALYDNLIKFCERYNKKIDSDQIVNAQNELIRDAVMDQLSMFEPSIDPEKLRRDFEKDIELLDQSDVSNKNHQVSSDSELKQVYLDTITNHITDILIDYHRLQDNRITTEEMITLRTKIFTLVDELTGKSSMISNDGQGFVRGVSEIWQEHIS